MEEELDFVIDLMHAADDVKIRRQFRSYEKPIEQLCIGIRHTVPNCHPRETLGRFT